MTTCTPVFCFCFVVGGDGSCVGVFIFVGGGVVCGVWGQLVSRSIDRVWINLSTNQSASLTDQLTTFSPYLPANTVNSPVPEKNSRAEK